MKLNAYKFGEELKKLGFDFYSGVPCSFLNSLINYKKILLCQIAVISAFYALTKGLNCWQPTFGVEKGLPLNFDLSNITLLVERHEELVPSKRQLHLQHLVHCVADARRRLLLEEGVRLRVRAVVKLVPKRSLAC